MKNNINKIFSTLFCFSYICAAGQVHISGRLTDENHQPVVAVAALLLHPDDGSLIKANLTNIKGRFVFDNVPLGRYRIATKNVVGYKDTESDVFETEGATKDLGTLILSENTTVLREVTIKSKVPLFEQKTDRLVANVENSITALGGSALDVLERMPGVRVDRQNNTITIAGKSGVQVMINGRLQYLPVSTLVERLGGMSAGNIRQIEVITAPPAHLDAEGNAGFINIVQKSNPNEGSNGSFGLSAGHGRGAIGSANANINCRSGALNIFADYAWFYDRREQYFDLNRRFVFEHSTRAVNSATYRQPQQNNNFLRAGVDYRLTQKTTVGALFSAYETRFDMNADNRAEFRLDGDLDTVVAIGQKELHRMRHIAGNMNLQHQFCEGQSLSFDADYLHYHDINPVSYLNRYADGTGIFLFETNTRSDKTTPIDIAVGKADYSRKWNNTFKMDAGIKAVRSTFVNDVRVDALSGTVWQKDPELTGKYRLKESIAAAYTAWDVRMSAKTNLKLGLRYEFTASNLGSTEQANIIDRRYGRWFPSAFVKHEINESNTLQAAYSRRITRPTFNELAPFVVFLDPNTFFGGNAALQPSFAHNINLGLRHKGIMFTAQYTHEDSTIMRFQARTDLRANRQILRSENLKNLKTLNISFNFPIKVCSGWEMQNDLSANRQQANTFDDAGKALRVNQLNFSINTAQRLTFSKYWSGEITGFYQSAALFGVYSSQPMYGANAGVQKKFGERGGALSFNVSDVFNSVVFRAQSNFSTQDIFINAHLDFSQRTFKLTYSRNFGKSQPNGSRSRVTGAEEERQRVN